MIKPAQDKANAERPLVQVITNEDGAPVEDGPELDLTQQDERGQYLHTVQQLVDNAQHHFDTARYFV